MRLTIAAVAISFVLTIAGVALAQTADPPAVAGTRIGLVPPAGFEPSQDFDGFSNRRAGASIIATELPQSAYVTLRAGLPEAAAWAKRGMTLIQIHRMDGFPYEHILVQARRTHSAAPVDVWTLVLAHRDLTATIVVNVSQGAKPALMPEQVKTLLAAVRVVAPPGDLLGRLSFTVDPPARFTHRRALAERQLVLKESPPPPVGATDDITATVSVVPQVPAKPEQREMFARQHLFAQQAVRIETLETPKPLTVAGMPALEMMGQGRNPAGEQRRVYVVMAFGAKSSYVVQAMGPDRRLDAALPDLQKLARSVKPK